jgi:type 1 glutamine amidotransferase
MQNTAGWIKPAGKGWIFYLGPGHRVKDFESPACAQLVLNAMIFKP